MKEPTLEDARAAKAELKERLRHLREFSGAGITWKDGLYAVQASFRTPPDVAAEVPDHIGEVPVVLRVIGDVRKQTL